MDAASSESHRPLQSRPAAARSVGNAGAGAAKIVTAQQPARIGTTAAPRRTATATRRVARLVEITLAIGGPPVVFTPTMQQV
jgi:hypothetical protein